MKKLLITLFAIMMATVSYAEDVTEETLRFVPGIWATDNAKFAAWVWGDNVEGAWTPFFTGEGDTLSTTINAQAESVIFVRLSSSATEPSWDENTMWNKTGDLTIDHQSLLYVITDWESGEWVTAPGNYYLIGNAEQLGSWNTENALPIENGTISLELPAGKYAFLVLPEDKSWNTALKYGAVNTRCSSLGLKTDADENIWFTLEETATITITIVNEKICISGAIKDFSDEVYSNYAIIVNHERIYGCAYAGNSSNWPQYSARVQLNVDDTIRIIDRMTSNYEMQVPSDEYGENDKFETYMYGEYRVCKVAGCYDIYYKTNGYLYITSTDNCSQGVEYDRLYIPYANVNITVTNEYENAQGYVEVNGTGIGNSGGVSASYVMGSHLTLQAYPNENFQFLQWSDGALENPRNLIVTGDTTIHADMGNLAYYPTGILLNHNRFIRSTYNDGTQLIVRANIQQGDKVELYFINDNIYWMAEVEPYGMYENFSGSAEQGYLICNVSGCYDIYFKMVDGITQSIYIGQGTVCNDGVPWTDPNTGYVYSVVGTENLFGTAWDIADTLTNMTPVGDGRFEYTLDSVTLTPEGDYQYKVIANHMWNVREYPSVEEDDNYHITVEESGVYSVLFSLDTIAGCTATTNYLHAIISGDDTGETMLCSTTFADWEAISASSTERTTVYSDITFTLYNVKVRPSERPSSVSDVSVGYINPTSSSSCYIQTDMLPYVSRVTFVQSSANAGRGWRLESSSDGENWYAFNENDEGCASANIAETREMNVYMENVWLRWIPTSTNAGTGIYLHEIAIYGKEGSSSTAPDCPIASGSCGLSGDNLTWVLGCDSVLTISGEGEMPTSYSGTSAPWYEHGAAIKHINIEEGVTKLALYAFYNSGNNYPNVQTLSIPSTLGAPIENNFFYQCPLKTITINSDTIVGKASYSSGSSLQNKFGAQVEEYTFGGSVRSIANFAFYNQSPDSLRSIILPEGLEAIGNWAFGYIEHLTSVSIPSTVQTIGTDAFAYCSNLRSVELGEGLMTVNGQAFWMCDSLTRVTCNALTPPTLNQTAFDHNQNDTLFIPCEAKESYKQADYWKNFSKIICADDTLQIIASGTFGAQGNNLTWTVDRNYTLTISGSGEMEFFNASEPWAEYRYQLRKIVVEEGVTNLSNVFRLHNQVTEVSLPNTLRVIEAQAFDQCSSITHLELPESVDSIGEGVFYLCESLQEIRIPSRVTMINSSLFRGCRGLRSVEFPNGLTRILTTAFQYCNELNALNLPASLTFIGQEAFADCTGLDTIIVLATTPPEVTQSAFDNVPDTIPVFVPTASLRAYRNHEEWSYFKNIHGIDGDGPETHTFTLTSSWQFIMLPTAFGLTQDDIVVDGEIEWGIYNSAQRASGRSGWQGFTPQNGFEGSQAYIVRARNGSATLTINIPDQAREQAAVTMAISYHPATREQNANWNFLGNPYPYNYDIMSALEEAEIESPVTIWNGTGYDLFTPGIDLKTLDPFEAFFIQLPDGGSEVLPLSPEHIKDTSDSGNNGNSVADTDGALPGYFTINTSKEKVRFSRGNLQYQASTATWQFAENQYDVIGEGNVNISATYDGWIDLFGWGTGDNPTKASTSKCDYSSFVDWGINAISNGGNTADMWRTLSANEWTYITGQRTNYESLCGRATVNGIQGFILLPDDWVSPGIPFQGSKDNGYELNQFTLADWQKMEAAGAVFLPACGGRTGTEMTSTAVQYWSTNEGSSCYAYDIITGGDTAFRLKTNQVERSSAFGVRLVK